MSTTNLRQEINADTPVLAICYDFDKTLTPDDMQAQGYIQSVGYDIPVFWAESNALAQTNDMDQNLAYMYLMIKRAAGKLVFTRQTLLEYGSKVALFPGVDSWFERINTYGKQNGIQVEHYIISSGLKEMIEGTEIAKNGVFKKIYASSFFYDDDGVAQWPAQAVNYTNKTQFLFRINKGVLDINDAGVNDSYAPEDLRVPFRNMVYIGDSDTDIPCMKLVNSNGGHSIGVYNSATKDKAKVYKMMRDNRIRYFTAADYTEDSELESLVKAIIQRTKSNEYLQTIHYECKRENTEMDSKKSAEQQEKTNLILSLEESNSFANTHTIIRKMVQQQWSSDEVERILGIGCNNTQVFYILKDPDLKGFYSTLLTATEQSSDHALCIMEQLNEND